MVEAIDEIVAQDAAGRTKKGERLLGALSDRVLYEGKSPEYMPVFKDFPNWRTDDGHYISALRGFRKISQTLKRHPEYVGGTVNRAINSLLWKGVYHMKESKTYNRFLNKAAKSITEARMSKFDPFFAKEFETPEEKYNAVTQYNHLRDGTYLEVRRDLKAKLDKYLAQRASLPNEYLGGRYKPSANQS